MPPDPAVRSRKFQKIAYPILAIVLVYLVVAYVILPAAWRVDEHRHTTWDDAPRITRTANDIPGDPLNIALDGTETEVKQAMLKAGWFPADPLTLESCLKIAEASVLKRPYTDAPVSNLILFGRKQDLAFEQPVGDNPRKRHHVRFWRWDKPAPDGRPAWFGSATYDEHVGLSHTTGQVTHHISGDVDAERNHLVGDLEKTGLVAETYFLNGFHKVLEGRNGGGDPWHTDGKLTVVVFKSGEPAAKP